MTYTATVTSESNRTENDLSKMRRGIPPADTLRTDSMMRRSEDYATVLTKRIRNQARHLNKSVDIENRLAFKTGTDRSGKVREVAMLADAEDDRLELELLQAIRSSHGSEQMRKY